jgi:hypothetical protein
MNEDFRDRLRKYTQGELSAEETAEVEKDLDKLQEYQLFMEEELIDQDKATGKDVQEANHYSEKETLRIITRAKWKARLQNALTAIGIVILVTIGCSVVTALYYTHGEPSRWDTIREIVESTIAVTEPNVTLSSSGSSAGTFFTMNKKYSLNRKVGGDEYYVGDMDLTFLLSRVKQNKQNWLTKGSNRYTSHYFYYPDDPNNWSSISKWSVLEKLPEGTVAEVYLSFDQCYPTADVLKKFKGKDMDVIWFAADTGMAKDQPTSCLGFPFHPILLNADRMNIQTKTEKKGLFTSVSTTGWSYPSYEEYGSAELRDKNFIDTLSLLAQHEDMAKRISLDADIDLNARIKYLQKHGVKIYGAAVTGPSREILKLQQESWVKKMHVGEVQFWNWDK